MQVDQKLLKRDGNLSWVERCRRKKDQVRNPEAPTDYPDYLVPPLTGAPH